MAIGRTSCRVATAVALLAPGAAMAAGFYNMPTSLQQCLGVGFGPGYHAPLLLGRSYKAHTASQPIRRLPAPLPVPSPPCFDAPSVWAGAPSAQTPSAFGLTGHVHDAHAPAASYGYMSGPTFSAPTAEAPPTDDGPEQLAAPPATTR